MTTQPNPDSNCTKIVALGDVVGRVGRRCVSEYVATIQSKYDPDIFIINGENLAGGFGINHKTFLQMTEELGVDVITTGNHWADKKSVHDFIDSTPNLLRPANMYNVHDFRNGFYIGKTRSGQPYAVINLLGCFAMKGENSCPFAMAKKIRHEIPSNIKIVILDMHAEATSEKQALAHYMVGDVSLFYGTHTHCPTADERILDEKMGFATDVGMTGAYDSVIGMKKEQSIKLFTEKTRVKFEPAKLDPKLFGLFAVIDNRTGFCRKLTRIKENLTF